MSGAVDVVMLIAVTAAAGKTSHAVVRELRSRGLAVGALVRRRDRRSEALQRLGAELIEADLLDAASLTRALKGVRRAYYCPPLQSETGRALNAFREAATANRLESFVG